jgi:serine/threonine-protein kinase HipA
MRQALIKYNNIEAGLLIETDQGEYLFEYSKSYIQEYPNQFCLESYF